MLRTLFTAYLEARGGLPANLFEGLKSDCFSEVLRSSRQTKTFFERMRETFNGDLFPPPPKTSEKSEAYSFTNAQLEVARSIVIRRDVMSGQQSFDFWRYDFEVIPIELISSIYERFIYAGNPELAKKRGTHYTPVNLVDLVFSQVFDDQLFDEPLGEKPKVLDLACGSGVFLVEAFRRLLSRRVAGGEKLTRTLVRDVLSKQLFGVDLEETAVEIAAFSLCLTAFELDPSPTSVNQLKFRESLKGKNLFVADAFDDAGFADEKAFKNRDFAIVVGNPPWKKTSGSKASKETASKSHIAFCASQDPPVELPYLSPIDQAFIWRSRHFAKPNGRIGLLVDAKNFFNQQEQSLKSKKQLFETIRPRVMLNLSALHNKKLFPSAEQPAMVFVAENAKTRKRDELVFASAERSDTFGKHGIVEIFLERVNHLPIAKVISERHLLKTAAHGTPRDHAILARLFSSNSSLGEVLAGWGTSLNSGYKGRSGGAKVPTELRGMKMLENTLLQRGSMRSADLPRFTRQSMGRARSPEIYKGPLCITQQKLQDNRLVAATVREDIVYSCSYFGIPAKAEPTADLLAGYLNSILAAYCFFLTSTRFGIDRQIANQCDFECLPFPDAPHDEAVKKRLSRIGARSEDAMSSDFESLDNTVFDLFHLCDWERDYISDVVSYDLDFVRHGSKSNAVTVPDEEHLKRYATTLVDAIRNDLSESNLKVNADIVTGMTDLCAVVIRFDESRRRKPKFVDVKDFESSERLANLLHAPVTSSFQLRRSLVMFDQDRCIIVKHAQKRFWSRARAYDDADTIFAELAR